MNTPEMKVDWSVFTKYRNTSGVDSSISPQKGLVALQSSRVINILIRCSELRASEEFCLPLEARFIPKPTSNTARTPALLAEHTLELVSFPIESNL